MGHLCLHIDNDRKSSHYDIVYPLRYLEKPVNNSSQFKHDVNGLRGTRWPRKPKEANATKRKENQKQKQYAGSIPRPFSLGDPVARRESSRLAFPAVAISTSRSAAQREKNPIDF